MIYSFLYVFVTSLSTILIQDLDAKISPLFSLFIISSIALIYFNLINIKSIKNIYTACWKHKAPWFLIMACVFVMWICAINAPGMIGGSLYTFLYFSCLGIIGFLSLAWQNWQKNFLKFYCAFSIIILLIISIFFEFHFSFSSEKILGVFISLLGGTTCFIYFQQSQKLMKNINLSATQILAMRFYLTMFLSLLFLPKQSFSYLSIKTSGVLLILAFVSMIIPLYLSQKALEKISSAQNAIIMSLCPLACAILQESVFHDVKIEQIYVYIAYSLTIASFYLIQLHNSKNTSKSFNLKIKI